MNIKAVIAAAIGAIRPLIPFIGPGAQGTVERAAQIPRTQVDQMCQGMSAEDKVEAYRLAQVMADAISDFVVFTASRGAIEAD